MTQWAVITGASSGIGLAAAERFQAAGYQVVCLSRRSCPLPGVISVPMDLTAGDWTAAVADWADQTIPPASVVTLVHNASASWHDSVSDVEPEQLRSMLELNVVAPQTLNRIFLPRMGAGSSVLYIGSTLAFKAVPNSFSYITAKHALIGVMRATCQDLYGRGIHTACICPGVTDTPMLRSLYNDEILSALAEMNSSRRLIRPSEIADAIYAVATNPVLNGGVINADYGQIER